MKHLLCSIGTALAVLATSGCDSSNASDAPAFEVMAKALDGVDLHKEIRVIENQNELNALYAHLSTSALGSAPAVDFNNDLVLYAATGVGNPGNVIRVESTGRASAASGNIKILTVKLVTKIPKGECGSNGSPSAPFVIAKIQRVSADTLVNVREETIDQQCGADGLID